jgi:hypothetical protein
MAAADADLLCYVTLFFVMLMLSAQLMLGHMLPAITAFIIRDMLKAAL